MPVSGEPAQAECRHAGGLISFSFQFFTRLGYVFAEEVGEFRCAQCCGHIWRCFAKIDLPIHFRTIGDEHLSDFFASVMGSTM